MRGTLYVTQSCIFSLDPCPHRHGVILRIILIALCGDKHEKIENRSRGDKDPPRLFKGSRLRWNWCRLPHRPGVEALSGAGAFLSQHWTCGETVNHVEI